MNLQRIILLLLVIGFSSPAYAKRQRKKWTFKIVRITGKVQAMMPRTSWWNVVKKGQVLQEGTLLSVLKGQAITLSVYHPNMEGKRAPTIDFDRWMTTRLDRHTLRKATKEKAYFADEGDLRNFTSGDSKVLSLGDAFKKLIAEAGFQDEAGDRVSKASQMEVENILPIQLLRPTIDHRISPETLPTTFSVVWLPIKSKKKPKYHLKMWIRGEGEADPELITRETMGTVEINGYGEYFIKIVTPDGRYASQAHKIEVLRPTDIVEVKGGKMKFDETEVRLLSPPAKLDAFVKDKVTNLEFNWEFADQLRANGAKFVLKVLRYGAEFKSLTTSEHSASIDLKEGAYTWYVTTKVHNPKYMAWKNSKRLKRKPRKYITATSKKSRFRINRKKAHMTRTEISRLLSAGAGKTIYLTEGL